VGVLDRKGAIVLTILDKQCQGQQLLSWCQTAIQNAEAAGQLFVTAAGNNNQTDIDLTPVYPAAYRNTNVMTVVATDQNDILAYYSNLGVRNTVIAAPGSSILSTTPNHSYR
jgi:hypothetical protein